MKPDMVVDVGNSRLKWGLCRGEYVESTCALPAGSPTAWQHQLADWKLTGPLAWAIGGVHPLRLDEMANWALARGDRVLILDIADKLPLEIGEVLTQALQDPNGVGIDRLLNAVAAKSRVQRRAPIVIIDAGTAVTVDRVNARGEFEGGAILPGLRLMGQALHDYTALLPTVEVKEVPVVPGTSTKPAIEAGVFWAVAGGVKALLRLMSTEKEFQRHRRVFLTGGDASLLSSVLDPEVTRWPTMTLEGIRLSAEALP